MYSKTDRAGWLAEHKKEKNPFMYNQRYLFMARDIIHWELKSVLGATMYVSVVLGMFRSPRSEHQTERDRDIAVHPIPTNVGTTCRDRRS